jgi:hypothetical protein
MDFIGCGRPSCAGQTKNPRLGQPWVFVKSLDQQAPTASFTTTTTRRTACDTFFNIGNSLGRALEKVKAVFYEKPA